MTSPAVGDYATAAFADSVTGPWSSYTPALTATTTNPTLGTSILVGSTATIGSVTFWRASLTIASGFTVGSGNYQFSLPVASLGTFREWSGSGSGVNAGSVRPLVATLQSALVVMLVRVSTEANVTNTGLGSSWAAGDSILLTGWYRSS